MFESESVLSRELEMSKVDYLILAESKDGSKAEGL